MNTVVEDSGPAQKAASFLLPSASLGGQRFYYWQRVSPTAFSNLAPHLKPFGGLGVSFFSLLPSPTPITPITTPRSPHPPQECFGFGESLGVQLANDISPRIWKPMCAWGKCNPYVSDSFTLNSSKRYFVRAI